jgi:PAT family acetyl-CoA transporter-like MFS transporter 1
MPSRLRKRKSRSPLPPPSPSPREMPRPAVSPGVSTSLNSVQITPRTPRTPRGLRPKYADVDEVAGVDAEEVEMSLLSGYERSRAEPGFADENGYIEAKHKAPFSLEDKRAMALLCVLCTWLPPLFPP